MMHGEVLSLLCNGIFSLLLHDNMQIGYLLNDHVKHFTLFGTGTTYYAWARAALAYMGMEVLDIYQ